MSKTIFRYYSEEEFKQLGLTFVSLITENDGYKPQHPYTDKPIPEELQGTDKLPFFDPITQQWMDKSQDAQVLADKRATEDLIQAKQDAADAKTTAAELRIELQQTTDAVIELAQATLPSDTADTTETKPTEPESTEGGAA
ncbi:hypothetical protein [Lacticaseibacillus sharpeae]|uniref:Uncharacterized protein n=1 Tax=Lacticaseibacillus sharpeae JCM 1186 = DSM 20505 TaxID=1291052 RepID=A0A0R1ZSH5_9LACO|nr:hypothetical protein [Lacticaseibacillus sharpeae]KRM54633.1 hypothetical protein FC18_GL002344 [Lacticaseibacillus sharpeae JCM 1186 = DSM 20505]